MFEVQTFGVAEYINKGYDVFLSLFFNCEAMTNLHLTQSIVLFFYLLLCYTAVAYRPNYSFRDGVKLHLTDE